MLKISQAETSEDIQIVRELFLEYAASGFDLCFQSFETELAELPGDYAPPRGRLLLARYESQPAGCVAMHRIADDVCEMKRLYVRPDFRGKGIGKALALSLLEAARQIGYFYMRLDTVEPVMKEAVAMYRRLGFREIPAYRPNPIPGAIYMELELLPPRTRKRAARNQRPERPLPQPVKSLTKIVVASRFYSDYYARTPKEPWLVSHFHHEYRRNHTKFPFAKRDVAGRH